MGRQQLKAAGLNYPISAEKAPKFIYGDEKRTRLFEGQPSERLVT